MKKILPAFLTLFALLAPAELFSKVVLAPIFSDNMVLQRNTDAKIWGKAGPGSEVSVKPSWSSGTYTAPVRPDGSWSILLPTPDAGGPYSIIFSDGEELRLENVLIGEVWLCGGQSNMVMPMEGLGRGVVRMEEELSNTDKVPGIRLLLVNKAFSHLPQENASVANGGWTVCTRETLSPFSAAAYYFGKHLYDALGVPVGLIESCWGGTRSEAWTSKEALSEVPAFEDELSIVDNLPEDLGKKVAEWHETLDAEDPSWKGGTRNWAGKDLDEFGWREILTPNKIEIIEGLNFHGSLWYRKTIDIPKDWAGKDLTLSLSTIDDNDWTFFNGVLVGHTDGNVAKRVYTIPRSLVKKGKAVIAVRVVEECWSGGLVGEPDEIFIQVKGKDGNRIPLTGMWKYKVSMPKRACLDPKPDELNFPTLLYNAMIHPLVGYSIRGTIWYQGESNADRTELYGTLLPLMIQDWRKAWGYTFPFYITQISSFTDPQVSESIDPKQPETGWPFVRETQLETSKHMKNCGLAVTIDIGEADDIHPINKYDVGKRLALQALAKTYGKDVVCDGPVYSGYVIKDGAIEISFDTDDGLRTSDGKDPIGFYIAGVDHVFHKAESRLSGNKVIVSSPKVKAPIAVRYAWAKNPLNNLVNDSGLPASPFRTDNWPQVTRR